MNLYKRCDCAEDRCHHPWWFRYRLQGLEIRESSQTAVHKVALEIARASRIDRIRTAAGLIASTAPAITLGELVKRYTAHVRADHPATAGRDVRVLAAFLEGFGAGIKIDTITPWEITQWRSTRITAGKSHTIAPDAVGRPGRRRSRQTVERDMNVIRGLFSRALEWRADTGLTTHPCETIKALSFDEKRIRIATPAELALLKTAPQVVRLLCELTLTSLGRLMEVARLTPQDLKGFGEKPTIQVRRKGGRIQQLPVHPEHMAELRACVTSLGQRYVLFGNDPPNQQILTNQIRRWWISMGVHGVSHHTMRHTGVTAMLDQGINARVIQKYAGWSSLRMLERYGHVSDAEMDRALAATTAVLARARSGESG